MIYIYDENLEVYDSMKNKSEFINKKLKEYRKPTTKKPDNSFDRKIAQIRRNAGAGK